jgi:hypothetical protein
VCLLCCNCSLAAACRPTQYISQCAERQRAELTKGRKKIKGKKRRRNWLMRNATRVACDLFALSLSLSPAIFFRAFAVSHLSRALSASSWTRQQAIFRRGLVRCPLRAREATLLQLVAAAAWRMIWRRTASTSLTFPVRISLLARKCLWRGTGRKERGTESV